MKSLSAFLVHGVAVAALTAAVPAAAAPAPGRVVFDIPPQSLDLALLAFSRQSGMQIISSSADLRDRSTRGLHGAHTPAAGLGRLLRGTGLRFLLSGASTATIVLQPEPRPAPPRPAAAPVAPRPAITVLRPAVPITGFELDSVVVTGSSIPGALPVGSAVVELTQDDIRSTPAQTLQQIMTAIPAVNGFGMAGQGAFQSNDQAGTNAPSIHGLGGSSSTSTLVLIDGHRFPLTGVTHTLGDPNIVPANALERVEVLVDGVSSVYGSDAIAGVVNFITRRRQNGVEAGAQVGYGDRYRTWTANLLAGRSWSDRYVWIAYAHSDRSRLRARDRAFTGADHRSQGGSNLAGFFCQPSSIQPTGASQVYLYPYSGPGVFNTQENAACDNSGAADLLPQEIRDAVMLKGMQALGGRLTITGDLVLSDRRNLSNLPRGATVSTIFGPGSGRGGQINPYYRDVPGSPATSQTIRLNYDELLGPGAVQRAGARDAYAHANLEYELKGEWRLLASGVVGADESFARSTGVVCSSCANLALNGTTNGLGDLSVPSVPATGQVVTQVLTAANALDPYTPAAANPTAPSVLAGLKETAAERRAWQSIADLSLQLNGPAFDLPGGPVEVAVGAQRTAYGLHAKSITSLNIGPSPGGSLYNAFDFPDRVVASAFGEALWPIVGPEMGVRGVRSLRVNTSARYDHYSDFGSTTNPRIGADWEVARGVKLRANWARSFAAPQVVHQGVNGTGLNVESGFGQATQVAGLPVASFPEAALLPGCAAVSVCTVGTGLVTGLQLNGGKPLEPQKGETWSVGADVAPAGARGVRIGLTYWNNVLRGGASAPSPSLAVGSPSLFSRFRLYPGGASPSEIGAATAGMPQSTALPAHVYYIYDFRIGNVLNLFVSGLDVHASYSRDTRFGRINLGNSLSYLLKFDQQTGDGPRFSILNTDGFNSTFPSIRLNGRARLGWEQGRASADAFVNYTGAYRNYGGSTVAPILRDRRNAPVGGGDRVRAQVTVDLHLAYALPGGAQVYADAANLFDRQPPFFNAAFGYDPLAANPLGRVISVGVRMALP